MTDRELGIHSLSFYSMQSFGIHVLLIVIAMAFAKITWDRLEEKRAENIQLVQSSVRVDVVAMPEMTLKELKTFEESPVEQEVAPAAKVAEPEVTTPDQPEYVKETKKQDFAAMLKNLSQKKEEEKPTKKPTKKEATLFDNQKLQKLVAAGNKISAGAALVGGSGEAATGVYAEYLGAMPAAVKPYWRLPSYLANQDLKARVRVYIRQDGSLIKAELYESSGVDEYDQRAMDAVKRASFKPMPEGYGPRGVAGEIVLGFPL